MRKEFGRYNKNINDPNMSEWGTHPFAVRMVKYIAYEGELRELKTSKINHGGKKSTEIP